MNIRTLVLVCGAIAAVVALTTGTGGFTSATADRGVEISVADDANALLGVERTTSGTVNGTTNLTVTVTNRFVDTSFTSVEVTVGGRSKTLTTLGSSETGSLAFPSANCDETVQITATGQHVQVTLTRPVPVTCQ